MKNTAKEGYQEAKKHHNKAFTLLKQLGNVPFFTVALSSTVIV